MSQKGYRYRVIYITITEAKKSAENKSLGTNSIIYCLTPSIGPPKKDRKQRIKNKNNRSLSFHFDFWVCGFVTLSVFSGFSDVPLYLANYSIKLIYVHIIRTSSMRGLK